MARLDIARGKAAWLTTALLAMVVIMVLLWLSVDAAKTGISHWYFDRATEQLILAQKERDLDAQRLYHDVSKAYLDRAESFQSDNPDFIALRLQQLEMEKALANSERTSLLVALNVEANRGLQISPTRAEFWSRLAMNVVELEGFDVAAVYALDRAKHYGPREYHTVYANTLITLGGRYQLSAEDYLSGWETLRENADDPDFSTMVRELADQIGALDQLEPILE